MNHSQNSKTKRQKDREMVYQLEGRPGLSTAVPLGLQHVLAMFTSNLAPILIIASVCGLSGADTVIMVQCAMFVSGLTTFIQLYPIKLGKNRQIGANLPMHSYLQLRPLELPAESALFSEDVLQEV